MPLYTTDALILRTYDFGEADQIVVFLTRDRGKKRGVAKNARRSRRRFGGALEPLTQGRVAYLEKERRELVHLNYVEVTRSPLATDHAEAVGYVGYFAELIDEWTPEADPNERLYRLGASVGEALAAGVPTEPLARYFEYWLLRLQGVYPSHVTCHRCGSGLEEFREGACLAPGEHVFTCPRCAAAADPSGRARGIGLSPEALAFLRAARTIGPEGLRDLAAPVGALRELEAVHRALIAMHLEKELKSVRVIREMKLRS